MDYFIVLQKSAGFFSFRHYTTSFPRRRESPDSLEIPFPYLRQCIIFWIASQARNDVIEYRHCEGKA